MLLLEILDTSHQGEAQMRHVTEYLSLPSSVLFSASEQLEVGANAVPAQAKYVTMTNCHSSCL